VEHLVAATLLALGLVTALHRPLAMPWTASLVVLAALAHGFAHGVEAPAAAPAYLLGMALSSAALHGLGLLAGLCSQGTPRLVRVAGGLVAAVGLVLLAGG
jgi:urease accessory protein